MAIKALQSEPATQAPVAIIKYSIFFSFGKGSGMGTGAVDLAEVRKKILQAAQDFSGQDNLDFEVMEVCQTCEGRGYLRAGKGGILTVDCKACKNVGGTKIL